MNRKVVVSKKPEVNTKSKFYTLDANKPFTFKSKETELYVKFLKDETFFSYLNGAQEKVREFIFSESEFGVTPCDLFSYSIEGS